MEDATPLMKFLAGAAGKWSPCIYIVGGAVRNYLIGRPIKDIDVVVDSVALGLDSTVFARNLQTIIPCRTSLVTNQYGVAILSISEDWILEGVNMRGETIEIATARKESYGGLDGKGYKPHMVEPATILEDLVRREFTFNTLLWRLSDLHDGPRTETVLDFLGTGLDHLHKMELNTPCDPDKTFTDDPTRMLRAVKFVAKYGFTIHDRVIGSIQRNARALKNMPWDAVRKIFTDDILLGPTPRESMSQLRVLGLLQVLKEMMEEESGMAAAIGRVTPKLSTLLNLDLVEYGLPVRTPLGFLESKDRERVRSFILRFPENEQLLLMALSRPPVDQPGIFGKFKIPANKRGDVVRLSRRVLLSDFTLLHDVPRLQSETEASVALEYDLVDG